MEDLNFVSGLQIADSFRYVQIEETEVLIDSRVYCRDIIQVEHNPWLNNVLYKYQTLIEQHFNHLRFENGDGIKRPQGGGRQEKYALLTESQCNFALSLSNNSPEVVIKKAELVADFELAKKQLKQSFERSLQNPIFDINELEAAHEFQLDILVCDGLQKDREIAKLKAENQRLKEAAAYSVQSGLPKPNDVDFNHDLDTLWDISGIVRRTYLIGLLKTYFAPNIHYIIIAPTKAPRAVAYTKYYMTESVYNCLLVSLRSLNGTDTSHFPEHITLSVEEYFRQGNQKNTLLGQSR